MTRRAPFLLTWMREVRDYDFATYLRERSGRTVAVATVKAVAWTLGTYADSDGTSVHPSQERIGRDCGLSVRQVALALTVLREIGFAERVREGSNQGRRAEPDGYNLRLLAEHRTPRSSDLATEHRTPRSSDPHGSGRNTGQEHRTRTPDPRVHLPKSETVVSNRTPSPPSPNHPPVGTANRDVVPSSSRPLVGTARVDDDGLAEIMQLVGGDLAHARKTADHILAGRQVHDPLAYVLGAIRNDPSAYRFRRGNPRRDQECELHPGEWHDRCRACALDRRLEKS